MVLQKYTNRTISEKDISELALRSKSNITTTYYFKNVTFDGICFKSISAYFNCIFRFRNVTFRDCDLSNIYINTNSCYIRGKIIFDGCNLENTTLPMYYQKRYIFKGNNMNAPKLFVPDKPFYAYKYTDHNLIVLEISEGTRCMKTTALNKHRAEKAKVISILNPDGTYSGITSCESWYDDNFIYTAGDEVAEPNCDYSLSIPNRPGIHFFMDIKDAYNFYRNIICK